MSVNEFKRLMLFVGVAAAVLPALADTDWQPDSVDASGGDTEASCAQIWGRIGVIEEWTSAAGDSWIYSDDGQFGAQWTGCWWPMCPMAPTQFEENATLAHYWSPNGETPPRMGGGSLTPSLHVKTIAQNKTWGSASVLDPESTGWWWVAPIALHDTSPQLMLMDDLDLIEISWDDPTTNDPTTTNGGGGSQTPGQYQVLQPTITGDAGGSYIADQYTPNVESEFSMLSVEYKFHGLCNRTSDNASVNEWTVVIESDMATWITYD